MLILSCETKIGSIARKSAKAQSVIRKKKLENGRQLKNGDADAVRASRKLRNMRAAKLV